VNLRDHLQALPPDALLPAGWLLAQLDSEPRLAPQAGPTPSPAPDEMLTAEEAGRRLGMSRRWAYEHADELPFTRRLPGGALRFSSRGLERWKESRR
jgi:predicted DNA-binding transcriptional regulator AlpA